MVSIIAFTIGCTGELQRSQVRTQSESKPESQTGLQPEKQNPSLDSNRIPSTFVFGKCEKNFSLTADISSSSGNGKVKSRIWDNDTLVISAEVSENCLTETITGSVDRNDNQLNLSYQAERKQTAKCSCIFPITYTIPNLVGQEFIVTLDGKSYAHDDFDASGKLNAVSELQQTVEATTETASESAPPSGENDFQKPVNDMIFPDQTCIKTFKHMFSQEEHACMFKTHKEIPNVEVLVQKEFGQFCALANGAVYCWHSQGAPKANLVSGSIGCAMSGEVEIADPGPILGDGKQGYSLCPVTPNGMEKGVTALAADENFVCAIKTDGIYCWGQSTLSNLPKKVENVTGTVDRFAGLSPDCILFEGGDAYCDYKLPNDTRPQSKRIPFNITGPIKKIEQNCLLYESGKLFCQGSRIESVDESLSFDNGRTFIESGVGDFVTQPGLCIIYNQEILCFKTSTLQEIFPKEPERAPEDLATTPLPSHTQYLPRPIPITQAFKIVAVKNPLILVSIPIKRFSENFFWAMTQQALWRWSGIPSEDDFSAEIISGQKWGVSAFVSDSCALINGIVYCI